MQCPRCHRYLPEGYKFCPYDGSGTVDRVDSSRLRAEPTKIRGRVLAGRYRIRGFVGMGSMARVYLAEDERSGTPVAVKVLEDPYRNDPSVRERFHREAKMASLIGHSSIVRVFDEGEREEDGAPFLVMEFLVGETVGDYVRREGTMPVQIAIPALEQAASALGAAHRAGIIHRDVKPDNLFLLGEPGSPYELKVVDFGLSKLPQSNLTAAGVVMGTPATMAPEQILGEPIDGRADLYALGMVAYRMLAGRQPFEDADDEVATLAHHVWTAPPPPSRFVEGIDPRLEQIVMTAIRKNPDDRFSTMEAMGEALERLTEGGRTAPDPLPDDKPYKTKTLVAQLVKASLGRAIEREEEEEEGET
ncbi:MAG: protein kinase [Polyangiaceae bacterium]|nr:protein kinase [Polyangiaceae bacterium]